MCCPCRTPRRSTSNWSRAHAREPLTAHTGASERPPRSCREFSRAPTCPSPHPTPVCQRLQSACLGWWRFRITCCIEPLRRLAAAGRSTVQRPRCPRLYVRAAASHLTLSLRLGFRRMRRPLGAHPIPLMGTLAPLTAAPPATGTAVADDEASICARALHPTPPLARIV